MRLFITLLTMGFLSTFFGCGKPEAPAATSSDPPPLTINQDDPEMRAAISEARRRLPEFKQFIAVPQAGVTVRVPLLRHGVQEVHDATLVGRKGDKLDVEITWDDNAPAIQRTYDMSEIRDWTILHNDGHRSGGFTTRVMLKKAKRKWGTLPPDLQALDQSFSRQTSAQ